MFEKAEIFSIADALARHAATRQVLVSRNIANADTPGYLAQDIADFSAAYDEAGEPRMARSRPGHLAAEEGASFAAAAPDAGQRSPNGNGVSLETEMVRAAKVQREHDLAIAVYGKSLDILRASLGRR